MVPITGVNMYNQHALLSIYLVCSTAPGPTTTTGNTFILPVFFSAADPVVGLPVMLPEILNPGQVVPSASN